MGMKERGRERVEVEKRWKMSLVRLPKHSCWNNAPSCLDSLRGCWEAARIRLTWAVIVSTHTHKRAHTETYKHTHTNIHTHTHTYTRTQTHTQQTLTHKHTQTHTHTHTWERGVMSSDKPKVEVLKVKSFIATAAAEVRQGKYSWEHSREID